jgi:4-oxalocrotonate tautomerase family enzyme
MPFINIKVLKGTLSVEKKNEMISRVTEIVAEIEARPIPKEKMIPHTWCLIEEVDFGSWGIGGNPVTPEMLKAVLEG